MEAYDEADMSGKARDVRFEGDCVAKLFAAPRKSNYRIRLNAALNQCCVPVVFLESMLLNLVAKIVLQHNQG
jgi:hypothetical protein